MAKTPTTDITRGERTPEQAQLCGDAETAQSSSCLDGGPSRRRVSTEAA